MFQRSTQKHEHTKQSDIKRISLIWQLRDDTDGGRDVHACYIDCTDVFLFFENSMSFVCCLYAVVSLVSCKSLRSSVQHC